MGNAQVKPESYLWYSTDWEEYCSYLKDKGKPQLVKLLTLAFVKNPNVEKEFKRIFKNKPFSKISKKKLCSFITNYKPHPVVHSCTNLTTLNGDIFEDYAIDELIYVMENGKRYCFTYEEIERLDKNPYTNSWLPDKIDLLRGKRKKVEPFDSTPKLRHNPDNLESVYRYKKSILKQEMATSPYRDIPFENLEKASQDELINVFSEHYPGLVDDFENKVDKRIILMKIFDIFKNIQEGMYDDDIMSEEEDDMFEEEEDSFSLNNSYDPYDDLLDNEYFDEEGVLRTTGDYESS